MRALRRSDGKVLMLALALAGLALGAMTLLGPLGAGPAPNAGDAVVGAAPWAPMPGAEREGELPHAWVTFSPTPTVTTTPAATRTVTPSATPSATPSSTATSTATPSPTPTATPIHLPTEDEPTRIVAPSIDLDAPVVGMDANLGVEGLVTWSVADYAAGYHRGTARPGHVGNMVISGHNNILGEVFRDLYLLAPGDAVYLWVGDMRYHYRVQATYRLPVTGAPIEVLRDNVRWLSPTDDERLTLVTCWPPWSNTHRTVVVCVPAAYQPSEGEGN